MARGEGDALQELDGKSIMLLSLGCDALQTGSDYYFIFRN